MRMPWVVVVVQRHDGSIDTYRIPNAFLNVGGAFSLDMLTGKSHSNEVTICVHGEAMQSRKVASPGVIPTIAIKGSQVIHGEIVDGE